MSAPVYSRQVNWWPVHTFAAPMLAAVDSWPMVGSQEWCELPDDDVRKIAAVYDGARHWALHVDINQEAMADAGSEISASADWSALAREINQRNTFRASRPWLKRVVS